MRPTAHFERRLFLSRHQRVMELRGLRRSLSLQLEKLQELAAEYRGEQRSVAAQLKRTKRQLRRTPQRDLRRISDARASLWKV